MALKLDSKIPAGELAQKWSNHKAAIKVVSPANKRKLDIIVIGTGLGGASAAASLGELGYNVKVFCIQDSPRRAHSIAAQGGINAAKNYQNDNDSVYRLFYDTIKGGDYRAREANVYRLAEVANLIIDQCVAQGVPFAREYGGLLANRSFGGAQVSRTFYARGQTGQQLLLGAYAALNKEIAAGSVKSYPRHEMLDLVIEDGEARGIIARNLVTGKLERFGAHAVVLASGGYGNVFFLSTNAMASNGSAAFQCYRRGAGFANPCFTQIHPTCIPVHGDQQSKLTLMSESLRNDGRIWVPKKLEDVKAIRSGAKKPSDVPEQDRDYYLERRHHVLGDVAGCVSCRTVHLRGVLAREGAAAVGTASAVAIDDDLAARESRISVRAADDELARGIHVQDIVVADQSRQLILGAFQTGLDAWNEDRAHVLADLLLHAFFGHLLGDALARGDEIVVLGRNHDGMYAQRTVRLFVVFDRYLRLGVGTQVGHHLPFAADDGQFLENDVREDERRRHVFARFVARIAEHDALIARALFFFGLAYDTLVDVRRLFVDRGEHAAGITVELIFAFGITDTVDYAACYVLDIDVGARTHFARDDDQTGGAERFAGYFGVGVVTKEFVENGIGNLIRNFVGVSFGHGLRRK